MIAARPFAAHLTESVQVGDREASVDLGLVEVIRTLWVGGFPTLASCEGGFPTTDLEWRYHHEGYIQFERGVDVWEALALIRWDKPGMVCVRHGATHPRIGWVVRFPSAKTMPAPEALPDRRTAS